MLTPEVQAGFVWELPSVLFASLRPGEMGAIRVRLSKLNEDLLAGALRTALKARFHKNARAKKRLSSPGLGREKTQITEPAPPHQISIFSEVRLI